MVIVKSEFSLALNQVASERGISVEDVVESMKQAIMAAFRKEHPEYIPEVDEEGVEKDNGVYVTIDESTGETQIMKDKKDITPPGFGRIAAQTARQVIIQKIREAEKKTVISHYQDQIGTLVRGRVIRRDMNNVYVDIGKTEAIIPREEQIRNETYVVNNRYIFYLKEISSSKAGYSRIIVSRSAPELITELFKREVPEIASGTVEVKNVVREPGERAKIAVYSNQSGVDPVGACVGQKGVRVQTVTDELNGKEKIDIIQWNNDIKIFITSALSPASVLKVEIDEERKQAKVTVTEEQAPLAIGKGGLNVNLAARLTGYEIDIAQIASEKPKVEVVVEDEAEEVTSQEEVSVEEKQEEATA
ncbi:transcription termination factor NusA [Candidatus Woesebacteria bacterium]|nr:transcription termination factor NusA [Candidatus Woesebacteria bacterium]